MSRFTLHKLSPLQAKKIWAIARELGIDADNLHLLVYSIASKEHISDLTKDEATNIIKKLVAMQATTPRDPKLISPKQINYAIFLIKKINTEKSWSMEENSLSQKMFSKNLKFLSKQNAISLIEALKKILERD